MQQVTLIILDNILVRVGEYAVADSVRCEVIHLTIDQYRESGMRLYQPVDWEYILKCKKHDHNSKPL